MASSSPRLPLARIHAARAVLADQLGPSPCWRLAAPTLAERVRGVVALAEALRATAVAILCGGNRAPERLGEIARIAAVP